MASVLMNKLQPYMAPGCENFEEVVVIADDYSVSTEKNGSAYCGTNTVITVYDDQNNIVDTYTLVVQGDINGDGVCDVFDCTLADMAANGYATVDGAFLEAGDFDYDSEVSVYDLQQIVDIATND